MQKQYAPQFLVEFLAMIAVNTVRRKISCFKPSENSRKPNSFINKNTANIMSTSKKRQAEETPAQTKPKKNKKRKPNAPDDELLDTELGLNTLFTKMDNQLLADHLAQKLGRFGTDLSAVEISDMTVSGTTYSTLELMKP